MIVIVRSSVFRVVALACLLTANTAFADSCVKQIFNRYCLGGTTDSLPGEARESDTDGELVTYELERNGKLVRIGVNNDRIVSVSRREPPGSWLNFTDWKTKLVRLYGRAEDLSEFPAYATSRSSKLNAINAGKGHARVRWQQNDWSVSLVWDHRDYISLLYELSGGNTPANDEGL